MIDLLAEAMFIPRDHTGIALSQQGNRCCPLKSVFFCLIFSSLLLLLRSAGIMQQIQPQLRVHSQTNVVTCVKCDLHLCDQAEKKEPLC